MDSKDKRNVTHEGDWEIERKENKREKTDLTDGDPAVQRIEWRIKKAYTLLR